MFFYSDLQDERIKGFNYATEPDRILVIGHDVVKFRGHQQQYLLRHVESEWICNCTRFQEIRSAGYAPFCRHVIGTERILEAQTSNTLRPLV